MVQCSLLLSELVDTLPALLRDQHGHRLPRSNHGLCLVPSRLDNKLALVKREALAQGKDGFNVARTFTLSESSQFLPTRDPMLHKEFSSNDTFPS